MSLNTTTIYPSADKQLSYDSLKSVLQQLEPNFRFQLALRLPTIRLAEKAVPLHISKLLFLESGFQLNDTKYRLGVIRQAREGLTPSSIKLKNQKVREDKERRRQTLEGAERWVKRLQSDLDELKKKKEEVEITESVVVNRAGHRKNREEQLNDLDTQLRNIRIYLEHSQLQVKFYQCKRDNLSSPFEMFISAHEDVSEWYCLHRTCHLQQKSERGIKISNQQVPWEPPISLYSSNARILAESIEIASYSPSRRYQVGCSSVWNFWKSFKRFGTSRKSSGASQPPFGSSGDGLYEIGGVSAFDSSKRPRFSVIPPFGHRCLTRRCEPLKDTLLILQRPLYDSHSHIFFVLTSLHETIIDFPLLVTLFDFHRCPDSRVMTMSSAIPDANKKLSYDCLKCVLQKLEVNFRFRLAERLPKISLAEKAVPLYISKLSISEGSVKINDTKYRLGIICKPREGPTPEIIKEEQRRGGCKCDFDRFGFEKRSLPELTPGDILIRDYDPAADLDMNLELAEANVVRDQKVLADMERERRDLQYGPEEVENLPQYPLELEPEELDRRRRRFQGVSREVRLQAINEEIRHMKMALEKDELYVLRFQCKRDDRPLPYDMFIQFTRKSSDGTVYIERFKHDRTLREAQKYLINKFLGNRQLVTKIRSLGFWARESNGLVIGLPEGIKFDVQGFGTSGNLSEVLQRVETILGHPNRPFTRLETDGLKLGDGRNPKVRDAGVLVLVNNWEVDVMALCREVPNKKFVISIGYVIQPGEYAMIVENLINAKGTLGTCYEFNQVRWYDTEGDPMRAIAARFENAAVEESLIIIPLPPSTAT
ncbi:hypothetical protein L5515_000040 [Caenorhabditis briggsae]|uniref:Uncharacterized protein n=1 Tax=Caenorhabditis briggsae TaxID=6238 RepID=A0AAE9J1Q0_CAEBR|nr:hypothetical protein L5515_000040 [Caenorhabditis briggsae]